MNARPNHPARLRVAHKRRVAGASSATRSERLEGPCYLYLLGLRSGGRVIGPCKIGIAYQPDARRRELQTGCPWPIVPLMLIWLPSRKSARSLEEYLLRCLAAEALCGEWIELEPVDVLRRIHWAIRDSVAEKSVDEYARQFEEWGCSDGHFISAIERVSPHSLEAPHA